MLIYPSDRSSSIVNRYLGSIWLIYAQINNNFLLKPIVSKYLNANRVQLPEIKQVQFISFRCSKCSFSDVFILRADVPISVVYFCPKLNNLLLILLYTFIPRTHTYLTVGLHCPWPAHIYSPKEIHKQFSLMKIYISCVTNCAVYKFMLTRITKIKLSKLSLKEKEEKGKSSEVRWVSQWIDG